MRTEAETHQFIISSKDLIDDLLFNRDYKGAFNILVKNNGNIG